MGRRKKNDILNNSSGDGNDVGSTSTIPSSNATSTNLTIPVRKSRRQIAQKQQSIEINIDNKKQNGENNKLIKNIEKIKNTNQVITNIIDPVDQVPIIVPRKRGRPRLSGNRNNSKIILTNEKNNTNKIDDNLKISSDNDSQKIINKLVDNLKTTKTETTEIIDTNLTNISNDNVIENNSYEIVNNNADEIVNDDNSNNIQEQIVQEETVICEHMEVEIDNVTSSVVVDNNISTANEEYIVNDIACEQVVVMDESHFNEEVEVKEEETGNNKQQNNVVLLIDNEIDTMVTNTEDVVTTNEYEIIEEGVECMSVNDNNQDSIDYLQNKQSDNESQLNLIDNSVKKSNNEINLVDNFDKQLIIEKNCQSKNKEKYINDDSKKINSNNSLNNDNMIIDNLEISTMRNSSTFDNDVNNDTTSKITSEKIYDINVNDGNDVVVETITTTTTEQVVEIKTHDDVNNTKINENSIEYSDYQNDTNDNNVDDDEESRESEIIMMMDNKKIYCNNNNNSNDTPSSNNKIDDLNELKNHQNQNDCDKKLCGEFRNRSGSTDTTGSDNGSNSSGIRRSSRIRSQGLMKQKSRGRGLVTKPIADVTKAMQERETLTSCSTSSSSTTNQKKDTIITMTSQDNYYNNNTTATTSSIASSSSSSSSDVQFDIQSDKENKKNVSLDTILNTTSSTSTTAMSTPIIPTTISPLTISSSSSLVGYDSDTTKPVKVKSRWRRSSELEMCGNTIGGYNKSSTTFGNIISDNSNNNTATVGGGVAQSNLLTSIDDTAMMTSSENNLLITKLKNLNNINNNIDDNNCDVVDQHHHQQQQQQQQQQLVKINDDKTSSVLSIIKEEEYDYELEQRLRQFERIKENLYLTERFTNKETKKMVCDCFLTEEDIERGELGCGEDCLNRLLMIECGSRCVVNNRCTNKRFQRCEYSKCQVFRTEKKGFGLRATNDISAGEFIMEYVGEVLSPKDFRRRAKVYSKDKNKHYYFMALKSDQIIDATTKGNISRFINHSCDPNSETQKWTVNGELRIGFFNRRFIAAGEEITFDYHFQRYGKEAQKCYCDAPNCRGWIGDTPDEEKNKKKNKNKNNKAHTDYLKTIITSTSSDSSSESSSESASESASSSVSSTPSASPAQSRSPSPVPSPSPSPSPSFSSSTKTSIKSTLTSPAVTVTPATTTTTSTSTSTATATTKPKRKTKIKTTKATTKKTTTTRKKKEIKKSFVEDEDLDEEIDKLCAIGLKNRVHTLNLSRLMVRSRESEHRNRLLKVIQNGEPACRRLFLDYHGLRLIWSYMMDVGDSNTKQIQQFKLELLKTLDTLPVPNKTMLMDSKVYGVVQKWSINEITNNSNNNNKDNSNNINNNNNDDDDNNKIEEKTDDVNNDANKCDIKIDTTSLPSDMEIQIQNDNINDDQIKNTTNENNNNDNIDNDNDNTIQLIIELANSILNKWSNLKEVFRIPKKERIEQMKEHEREADSGYIRDDIEKEERRESYERTRSDRYSIRRDELSSLTTSTALISTIAKDREKIERRNGIGNCIGSGSIGNNNGSGIKGRDSPDLDILYRNKDKRNSDERGNLVSVPRLSKYERRQLFALKVAKEEEEERLRKQQQNMWQEHEKRCIALGIDPYTTAAIDPQTGYPLYYDPSIGQWQSSYHSSTKQSIQETTDIISPSSIPSQSQPPSQCNPIYMSTNTQPINAPSLPINAPHHHHHHHHHPHHHQHSHHHHHSQHPQHQQPHNQHVSTNLLVYDNINHQSVPSTYPTSFNNNLITLHNNSGPNNTANGATTINTVQPSHHHNNNYSANIKLDKPSTVDLQISPLAPKIENNQQQQQQLAEVTEVPLLLDLPPKWKCAKDLRGRMYYYHIKERIPQWLPPLPIHIGAQPDDSSSSEESSEDESSTSDDNNDDIITYDNSDNLDNDDNDNVDCDSGGIGVNVSGGSNENDDVNMIVDDNNSLGVLKTVKIVTKINSKKLINCNLKTKKRRIGLVQERIISPRREEDRVAHKKYKNIKDKLRRQKEQRGKAKENIHEKVKKHRRANKSKSHARHTAIKLQTIAQSNELSAERKIKDTFRINMANVIVRYLNPHRQNDCKQGRITNTEDFKFLARKLTHFVLAKELKHCKSVDELQCNENVKHKAKDFVRKYMNKFGPVYQRSSDEDY